jgi:hypothetical protein
MYRIMFLPSRPGKVPIILFSTEDTQGRQSQTIDNFALATKIRSRSVFFSIKKA